MAYGFLETLSTPGVQAAQAANGSLEMWKGFSSDRSFDHFTEDEEAFVLARDSFYTATVSESGWPYIQHRGSPSSLRFATDRALSGRLRHA